MHFIPRPARSLQPAVDNATGRRLRRRTLLAALTAASAVLIAACGGSASRTSATHAAVTPASAPASDPVSSARVLVRSSSLGKIIVDGQGRTLYMFTSDHAGQSMCTGMCAHFWPPYTTKGRPTGGPGVKASLLGVSHAANGQSVVTYRGHPLYRFLKDTRPGQVNGEDVSAFGGRWDGLSPAGTRITKRHKTPAATHSAQSPTITTQASPPPATTTQATPPPATTPAAPPPATTTQAAPPTPKPSSGSGIPQGGGGDGDLDNHGGPSDGDGNV